MDRPDLPETIVRDTLWLRHVVWSGNPPHAPYAYGWLFKLDRYTTPEERAWLKAHGWRFSGGKWGKPD